MRGVKKVEKFMTSIDVLGPARTEYFEYIIGAALTQELVTIFGDDAKNGIREFLYGIDCLIEIIRTDNIPVKKFLNNEDVDDRLVMLCQLRARTEIKPEYFGCQVTPAVSELIKEFFEHKYLRNFNYVLSKLNRPKLMMHIDGHPFLLSIDKEWSTQTSTSVLHFRDLDKVDYRISIPFKRTRLFA